VSLLLVRRDPQIVEVLDRERADTAQAIADAGICETAESHRT